MKEYCEPLPFALNEVCRPCLDFLLRFHGFVNCSKLNRYVMAGYWLRSVSYVHLREVSNHLLGDFIQYQLLK